MKLALNVYLYEEYIYFDPKDPCGPAKIRDDAPEWAKKLYWEDRKLVEEKTRKGYL